jgi:hypothetical protein
VVKAALVSKKWKCSKDWANIQILLTCNKNNSFTDYIYQKKISRQTPNAADHKYKLLS